MENKLKKENVDILAYRELHQLDGDLRRMLQDRDDSNKQFSVTLANQNKVIKMLEKEKEELQNLLQFSKSKVKKTEKTSVFEDIKNSLRKYEEYSALGNKKKQEITCINSKLKALSKNVNVYKQTKKVESEDNEGELLKVKDIQSRLSVEAGIFNEIMTTNRILKEETNSLLNQRIKFNDMFEKLVVKLCKGKKTLFEFIDKSADAYDNRCGIILMIDSLKTEAQKVFHLNCNEFRDLDSQHHYEKSLNKFLGKKSKKRMNEDENDKSLERNLTRKVLQQKLDFYNSIIKQIEDKYEENNLDNLLNSFFRVEEDNFNIYSFLNDHYTKINQVIYETQLLQKEINDKRNENEKKKEAQMETLKKTTAEFNELENKLNMNKSVLRMFETDFECILEGIKDLFDIMECDWKPLHSRLGMNETLNPSNIDIFMRIMEYRLSVLCSSVRFRTLKARGTTRANSTTSPHFIQSSSDQLKTQSKFVTPCPFCADNMDMPQQSDLLRPYNNEEIKKSVENDRKRGRWRPVLHNISECPQSEVDRRIKSN